MVQGCSPMVVNRLRDNGLEEYHYGETLHWAGIHLLHIQTSRVLFHLKGHLLDSWDKVWVLRYLQYRDPQEISNTICKIWYTCLGQV